MHPVYWNFNKGDDQQTIFASNQEMRGIKDEFVGKWTNPSGTFDISINRAMRQDNGTYTCMVVSGASNVRMKEVDLVVKVPPSVPYIDSPADKKLTIGEPGKIHCISDDGIPKPTYTWYKCDNENQNSCSPMPDTAVKDKARYGNSTFQQVIDTEFTGDKVLQFHIVQEIDAGYYMCEASNSAGSTSSAVTYVDATTVSMASVVGIVFGVIFGVAFLLVVAFMIYKKTKGDDDDDYEDEHGANDVFIGGEHTEHREDDKVLHHPV